MCPGGVPGGGSRQLSACPLPGDAQGDGRGDGHEGADPLRRGDAEDLPQRGERHAAPWVGGQGTGLSFPMPVWGVGHSAGVVL